MRKRLSLSGKYANTIIKKFPGNMSQLSLNLKKKTKQRRKSALTGSRLMSEENSITHHIETAT